MTLIHNSSYYLRFVKILTIVVNLLTIRIYVVGLVLEWIKRNGGLEGMQNFAREKSSKVYDVIDNSGGFYTCPIKRNARSRMNVPFRIKDGDVKLEEKFLLGAITRGMMQLKGHRSVKSIYQRSVKSIYQRESNLTTVKLWQKMMILFTCSL